MPEKYKVKIHEAAEKGKRQGFNLHLSLNLVNLYDGKSPEEIFACASDRKMCAI